MAKDKRETLKQFQEGVMLAEGEQNAAHRIRASKEVHAWLKTLTAEQRGAVLARAYAERQITPPEPQERQEGASKPSKGQEPTKEQQTAPELTQAQQRVIRVLKIGGVAEYDHDVKKWLAGLGHGVEVQQTDLESLASLELLEVSGEELGAVYRLKKPSSTEKTSKGRRKGKK